MDKHQSYGVIVPQVGYRSPSICGCWCATPQAVIEKTQTTEILVLVLEQADVQPFLECSNHYCVIWLENGSWEKGSPRLHLSYRQQSATQHKTVPVRSSKSIRTTSSKQQIQGLSIVCKVPLPLLQYEKMCELVEVLMPRLERLLSEIVAMDGFVPKTEQKMLSDVAKKQQLMAVITQEGLEFYKLKPGGVQRALVKINLEKVQMELVTSDRKRSGLELWKHLRTMFYVPFAELYLRSVHQPIECLNDVIKQLSPREMNRQMRHMAFGSTTGIQHSLQVIQNGTLAEATKELHQFVEMDVETDEDVLESWVNQGLLQVIVQRVAQLPGSDENCWNAFQIATQACLMVLNDPTCGKQAAGHLICSLDIQLQSLRKQSSPQLYCLLINCIELNHVKHAITTMHFSDKLISHLRELDEFIKSKIKQHTTKQPQSQKQQQQQAAGNRRNVQKKQSRQRTLESNDTANQYDQSQQRSKASQLQVTRTNSGRSQSEMPTSSIRTIHETEEFLEEEISAEMPSTDQFSSTNSTPITLMSSLPSFPSSTNSAPLALPGSSRIFQEGHLFNKSASVRIGEYGNRINRQLNIPRLALGETLQQESSGGIGGLTRSTRRTFSSTSSVNPMGYNTHRTIHSSISHIEQDAVGAMNLVAQALGSSLFAADLAGFVAHRRMAALLGDCATPSSRALNTARSSVSEQQSSSRMQKFMEDEIMDKLKEYLIENIRGQWGNASQIKTANLPEFLTLGCAILLILIKLSPVYFPQFGSNLILNPGLLDFLTQLLNQAIAVQIEGILETKNSSMFQRLLIIALTALSPVSVSQRIVQDNSFNGMGGHCVRIGPQATDLSDNVLQALSEVLWRQTADWGQSLPSSRDLNVVVRVLSVLDDYMQKSWQARKGYLFLKHCGEVILRVEMILSLHGEVEQWQPQALLLMEALLKVFTSLLNCSKHDFLLLGLLLSLLFDSHESSGRLIDYAELCLSSQHRYGQSSNKEVTRDMKLGLLKFMDVLFDMISQLSDSDGEATQSSILRARQTAGLFQGLFDPVKGSVMQMIDRVSSSSSGNVQVEMAMLKTLKSFFKIQQNPVISREEWMNQYIQTLFLVFAKTYHRDNVLSEDQAGKHLEYQRIQANRVRLDQACCLSLQILLQILSHQTIPIRRRFYQLRVMDFLIRELALEYEYSADQHQALLQNEEQAVEDVELSELDNRTQTQEQTRSIQYKPDNLVPTLSFTNEVVNRQPSNKEIIQDGMNIHDNQIGENSSHPKFEIGTRETDLGSLTSALSQMFHTPKETFQPESPHMQERRQQENAISREPSATMDRTLDSTWDISIAKGVGESMVGSMPSGDVLNSTVDSTWDFSIAKGAAESLGGSIISEQAKHNMAGAACSVGYGNDLSETYDASSTWDISIAKGLRGNEAAPAHVQGTRQKMGMPLLFTGEQSEDYIVLKNWKNTPRSQQENPQLMVERAPLSHPSLKGLPIPQLKMQKGSSEGLFQRTLQLVQQSNESMQNARASPEPQFGGVIPKLQLVSTQQQESVQHPKEPVQQNTTVPKLSLNLHTGNNTEQQKQQLQSQPGSQLLVTCDDNSLGPSTPTDTDVGHSARENKMYNSGPIGRTNSAHQSSYGQQRIRRRVYTIEGLHLTSLCVVIRLMLTKENQLDPAYCDSQPFEKGMYNIPFILQHHLNHPENEYILAALSTFVHRTGPAATNLYKLLVKHSLADTLYSQVGARLGRGAYGHIVQCRLPDELGAGKHVALKKVDVPKFVFDTCSFVEVFKEASILDQFRNSGQICKLYDVGVTNETYFLVLKYYKCSLKYWRNNLNRMCQQQKKPEILGDRLALYLNIFKQVVEAVGKIVGANVVHFDLKCDNILVEPREGIPEKEFWNPRTPVPPFQIVIADFGEAQQWGAGQEVLTTRNRGTECIKSPEMLMIANAEKKGRDTYDRRKKQGSGLPSDIWSLGCLLYELVTGEFMFDDTDWVQFFVQITSPEQPVLTQHLLKKLEDVPLVCELLEYILIREPIRRPSLDNVRVKLEALMTSVYIPIYHPIITPMVNPIPTRSHVEEFDHAQLQNEFVKPLSGSIGYYHGNMVMVAEGVYLASSYSVSAAQRLRQSGISHILLLHELDSELLYNCIEGKQMSGLQSDTKAKVEEAGNIITAAQVCGCEVQLVSLQDEEDAFFKVAPMLLRTIQNILSFGCAPSDSIGKQELKKESTGRVAIVGCQRCAGDAILVALATCMLLNNVNAYQALVDMRTRYLGLSMDGRQLSLLMQWSQQRHQVQRIMKMGAGKSTCLCGCCKVSLTRPLDILHGRNPRRCSHSLDECKDCFINCRALIEGLEHRYGYLVDCMIWAQTRGRDLYIDPLSPLQRLEIKQRKARRQLLRSNMDLYVCGVCSVVVLAQKSIQDYDHNNVIDIRVEDEIYLNLNWM